MFSWFRKKNIAAVNNNKIQEILEAKRCPHCPQNCTLSSPGCKRGKKESKMVTESVIEVIMMFDVYSYNV